MRRNARDDASTPTDPTDDTWSHQAKLVPLDAEDNDAFGTAHRAHASTAIITEFLPKENCVAGFLLDKEIKYLGQAVADEPVVLAPGERALLPTGLAMEIPPGYEGQVRPRSGLALKKGIALVNSPGTIDADYRGEIGIIIINHGNEAVEIMPGDRVAQLIIAPVTRAALIEVDGLNDTGRNSGGFGHTGLSHKL